MIPQEAFLADELLDLQDYQVGGDRPGTAVPVVKAMGYVQQNPSSYSVCTPLYAVSTPFETVRRGIPPPGAPLPNFEKKRNNAGYFPIPIEKTISFPNSKLLEEVI